MHCWNKQVVKLKEMEVVAVAHILHHTVVAKADNSLQVVPHSLLVAL